LIQERVEFALRFIPPTRRPVAQVQLEQPVDGRCLLHFGLARSGRVDQSRNVAALETDAAEDGDHVFIEERTVDVHVKRLREALGEAGNMVETVRGVGYRMTGQP
jgi:hypothetical protein